MHDALVPHSPRDRSIRSAARAALQGILLCTLDYGPRSRVKIWRGKTAKDSETVRVRLLRSHQCRGRCGSLPRSEEHTSELQSLMRISYAVFCLKKKK